MNVLKKIVDLSKDNKKIFLKDENLTYEKFYKNQKKYYKLLKTFMNEKQRNIIAICANYSPDFLSLIFAANQNKCIITFINPSSTLKEKNHIISDSGANLIIFEKKFCLKKKKYLNLFDFKVWKRKDKNNTLKKNDSFIIYTSGTTKKPKGVVLTNEAISNNVMSISNNLKLNEKYSSIIFTPPAYAMGISQILTYMLNQMSIILVSTGNKFPYEIINSIYKNKINLINLNISALRIFKNYILSKRKKFHFVKIVMAGGMQLSNRDIQNYRESFPKAKIINFYGCTENSPRISHYHITKKTKNKGTIWPVGKALNFIKIKIVNNNKSKFGKILISGKSLMRGYNKLNKLTNRRIVNDWFNTGDLGFFDKNKNLVLTGREDDSFRVGQEKLCPEEIEPILKKKFHLSEAIIGKKSNKILNWEPVLVLKKMNRKINLDKMKDILSKEISNYKIPRKILYLKSMPKTAYGKYDRQKINQIINIK